MKYKFVTVFVAGIILSMPPIAEKLSYALEGQPEPAEGQAAITSVDQGDGTRDSGNSDAATKEERKAQFEAKREEKKQEIEAKLDANRQALLEQKCEIAQDRLDQVVQRANDSYTRHVNATTSVSDRLSGLVARLNENHPTIDIAPLELALEDFQNESQSFLADFELYLGALESAADLENCSDDPEGFHEALEIAKSLRTDLKDAQSQLKTALKDNVKSALETIRAGLRDGTPNNSTEPTDAATREEQTTNQEDQ